MSNTTNLFDLFCYDVYMFLLSQPCYGPVSLHCCVVEKTVELKDGNTIT